MNTSDKISNHQLLSNLWDFLVNLLFLAVSIVVCHFKYPFFSQISETVEKFIGYFWQYCFIPFSTLYPLRFHFYRKSACTIDDFSCSQNRAL